MIEGARVDIDEDGFFLVLDGDFTTPVKAYLARDDGRLVLKIGRDAVFELVAACRQDLEPWVNEYEHHRALHAADPRGMLHVLPGVESDSGYDPDDPKSPGWSERVADAADLARKREKGE
jgi:hypothetical protein